MRRQSVRILLDAPQGAQPIARICAVNAYVQTLSTEAQSGTVRLMMRACFRVLYIASGTGELTGFDTYADFELNTDCSCTPASTVFACPDIDTLQAALRAASAKYAWCCSWGLRCPPPARCACLPIYRNRPGKALRPVHIHCPQRRDAFFRGRGWVLPAGACAAEPRP